MSRSPTAVAPAKADTKSDVDSLKSDIDELRKDMRKLMDDAGGIARKQSERGLERGRELADQAVHHVSDAKSSLEERVRENPLAAIGLALGAGVLLAAISRR